VLTPLVLLNQSPVLTPSLLRNLWACLILALFTACGSPVTRVDLQNPDPNSAAANEAPRVLVVTLNGKLGTTELARCHRSIREAEQHGCSYVIFRIEDAGTYGESLSDLNSLMDRVQSTDVATVAVLRGRVTQGAAALALCTTSTYLMKGADWGEITKPEKEVEVLLATEPEQAQNALFDSARAIMQSRLNKRRNKLRPDAVKLALAMADPRVQLISATIREGGIERPRIISQDELVALQASGATILGEKPMLRPLMLTAAEAEEFGLSSGTLSGYNQLLEWLNIDPNTVGELHENWAERMVGWLELLQPFLLVAGFLFLLIEVKTPGTGLPGIIGVAFLALAMVYSYLVGLAEVTEIIVFFLGIVAIAVEIFVLPGTVVFGLVGFLCLILSLVLSRQSFVLPSNSIEEDLLVTNLFHLSMMFILVLALGAAMWRILPKVPVFNRMFLVPPGTGNEPESNSVASGLGLNHDNLVRLVGRTGKAATVLRPTGTIELEGERYDVVTEGEFVDQGASVRVLYVQGNRVVVAGEGVESESPADTRDGERGSVGLVILLTVIGLVLIVAEVIFVSMGLIGMIAGGTLLTAIFFAFQVSTGFGIAIALVEAIAAPIVLMWSFKILPKTPFGKRLILSGPPTDGSAAAGNQQLASLVGKSGVAISALRPAGYARIDNAKVDVVTRGELLEKDCAIIVHEVSGNRVVVKATGGATAAMPPPS
jgi:membrane-bound serine protease (ClpP class)